MAQMAEIFFYHLERSSLEQLLPSLLEKTLKRGWKAIIQLDSQDRAKAISGILWKAREDGFLPHAVKDDPAFTDYTDVQPLWLTWENDTPIQAQALFLADGAMREDFSPFERVSLIFNGHDESQLSQARDNWRRLKESDHTLSYWQQSAQGGWQQKT